MFERFDPSKRESLERRRGIAYLLALGAYLSVGVYGVLQHQEKSVEVELEPEAQNFELEEEPEEEEEELEEEEAPPPPPEAPPPKPRPKAKPKPKPKPVLPDTLPDSPLPELDSARPDKVFGTGTGGTGTARKLPKPKAKPKPKPKPAQKPKPKPKIKKIDPTKPIKRPEGASEPKPDPGNKPPKMPSEMANKGWEGEVVIKLHVHRDGTVKGAKVLRVKSTATGEDDQKKAKILMLKAVKAAVKSWKFTPSKLKGTAISVWINVTLPFKLKAG